ncbi:MAG: hypothetical protein O3B05_01645 [archaeon]|nr:hypothetical protein [archaeon]
MEPRRLRALLLVAVLLSLSLPVAAANDGVAIVVSSLPTEVVDVDLEEALTIEVAAEGSGGNVEVSFSITNAESIVVWNRSAAVVLGTGEAEDVTVNLSDIPFGNHTVEVVLTGDVLASNVTHVANATVAVHRDHPRDISILASNSDRLEALTPDAQPSGLDARDGDRVAWFVTLRNLGGTPWSGILAATFVQGTTNESMEVNVEVNASSDLQVVLHTNATWVEGSLELNATLLNVDDDNSADDAFAWSATIAPPPLPALAFSLEATSVPEQPGDALSHHLWVNNTGEAVFNGSISCFWGDGQAYDATGNVSIGIGAGLLFNLSGTARDGLLVCSAGGARLAAGSPTNVSDALSMPSAVFELVAGGAPLALNGPWDVGDDVTWSAIVRNIGDREGHASLVLTSGAFQHETEPVLLGPGEAAELRLTFPLEDAGIGLWSWAVESEDGSVVDGRGMTPLDVHDAPSLHMEMGPLGIDEQRGVVVPWSVNLTSSRAREAVLEVGHGSPGAWVWSTAVPLLLDGGWVEGEAALGWPSAERVAVRLTPVEWTADGGPLLLSEAVDGTSPSLTLQLQRQVQPADPTPGASVTVTLTVSNEGDKQSTEGSVHLIAGRGAVLAAEPLPSLSPGEQQDLRFTVVWPEGSTVDMTAYAWNDAGLVLAQLSYDVSTVEQGDTLAVPWRSVALGSSAAVVLLLVESIRRRSPRSPKTPSEGKVAPQPSASSSPSSEEEAKVEVACPSCERSLRVPASYDGAVRCPDCKERFEVHATTVKEQEAPPASDADDVEVVDLPDKIDIACPACAQTLRVPASFSGRVRCPACRNEFQRSEAA